MQHICSASTHQTTHQFSALINLLLWSA